MNRLFISIIIVAVLGAALTVFIRSTPPPPPLCNGCNVLLISLDTFGAKHASLYNPGIRTTPFLETLAEKSVVFDRAYAQSSWTLPSHAALLTGQYPWDIDVWDVLDPLPTTSTTIASYLESAGYQTGAFSFGAFVQPFMNFDLGFSEFVGSPSQATWNDIPDIFNDALGWLDRRDDTRPFFLFLRPFELHDPYGAGDGEVHLGEIVDLNTADEPPPQEEARRLRDLYRSDIARVDSALQTLFDELENRGVLENTVIIITSDHGEEFGEHGTVGFHSVTLYAENTHVPLLITLPNGESTRVPYTVEVRSIPATIAELIGKPIPATFAGASLVPLIRGTEAANRTVRSLTIHQRDKLLSTIEAAYESVKNNPVSERLPERREAYEGPYLASVREGNWHALRTFAGARELYRLDTDPEEQANLEPSLLSFTRSLSGDDRRTLQKVLTELDAFTP